LSDSIALPEESDYDIVIEESEGISVQATIYDNLTATDYLIEGQTQES
jgi:hypothetical protein